MLLGEKLCVFVFADPLHDLCKYVMLWSINGDEEHVRVVCWAQAFHTLYHTDESVLLGAPTGSGKTISAELAMLRVFNAHPGKKVIYIAPLKVCIACTCPLNSNLHAASSIAPC